MSNQQKTILFWLGVVFAVVVIIFFIVTIQQKRDTAPSTNQVSFTGEGKISIKPDLAIIQFSILTQTTTTKAAQDANAAKSKKVFEFLKKQGIEEKDIKTTYYNITPQYTYPIRPLPLQPVTLFEGAAPQIYPVPTYSKDAPKISGYEVTQGYELKFRDFEKVSAVVDGLVSAGANQVQNVRFTIEEEQRHIAEAREKAIKDAKEKAMSLQKQIGIRLGKIVNYYDNTQNYPYYLGKGLEMGGGGVDGYGGGGPVLPPGENEIVINVTITYQIK